MDDILPQKKWVKTVPYTKLVFETILFTSHLLIKKGIKEYPRFRIQYQRNKLYSGIFYPYNSLIVVYVNNHSNIPALIDTILHECCHFIQNNSLPVEYAKYEKYQKTHGAWKNPLEVESRKFASRYTKSCLKYLKSMKVIERI